MIKALALLVVLGSVAYARKPMPLAAPTKITSDKARPLIRALKLANVKSKKAKQTTTWSAKSLTCTTTKADMPEAIEETVCEIDGKKVTGAAAVVLEDGMTKAGIPSPYMMAKGGTRTQITALTLSCAYELDVRISPEDGPFVCTYTTESRPN
jgi:hypothetical protein